MASEQQLKIEIDGQSTTVPQGATVLQAARKLGIDIPTLCYHESLPLYASCRVCIVEMSIESRGRTYNWIDASCAYPVEDGLRVQTDSPKVRKRRKLILELLLSRAPESETLKALAKEYGAEAGRFVSADKGEANCILCGLCIRVCNEMIHAGGIGTAFRGVHKKVVTPFKVAKDVCVGCTACAYVCPTGAITVIESGGRTRLPDWEADVEMMKCVECGKAYAPLPYLKQVKAAVDLRAEVLDRCPACRRKMSASTI